MRVEKKDGHGKGEHREKDGRYIAKPGSTGRDGNRIDKKDKDGGEMGWRNQDYRNGINDETKARGAENHEKGARGGSRYKNRAVCRYYLEDNCRFKENCWYSHDDRDVEEEADRMKTKLSFLEKSMRRSKKH